MHDKLGSEYQTSRAFKWSMVVQLANGQAFLMPFEYRFGFQMVKPELPQF